MRGIAPGLATDNVAGNNSDGDVVHRAVQFIEHDFELGECLVLLVDDRPVRHLRVAFPFAVARHLGKR